MFRSIRDALPDIREWSGGPPGCLRVVGCPSRKIGRPARRSGNGPDNLQDVPEGWEALPDVRQLLGGLPGCAGGPPVCSRVVGRSSQMFESGREVLPNV